METTKYATLWIALSLFAMISCTKENPAYNRENIKASWLFDTKDGSLIPEKEYLIYKFEEGGIVSLTGVRNIENENYKWGSEYLRYNVHCSNLKISGNLSGFNDISAAIRVDQEYEIIKQKDSSLTISPILYKIDSLDITPDYTLATMRKMPGIYASIDSLLGVWEINSIGAEAINTFRLEFLEKGKLNFYLKQSNGTWSLLEVEEDEDSYYNPYYNFVTITLYDNELLGRKDKWDVSIFDIVSLTPLSEKMVLSKDDQEYSFTLIKSQEEEEDETS